MLLAARRRTVTAAGASAKVLWTGADQVTPGKP
jgi:hypothetical protein